MAPVSKIHKEETHKGEDEDEVKIVPLKLATNGLSIAEDEEDVLLKEGATRIWEWRRSISCWHWMTERALNGADRDDDDISDTWLAIRSIDTWLALANWEPKDLLPAVLTHDL